MNRRSFLKQLAALGAGIVVVGPAVLAEVQRHLTPAEVPPTKDFFSVYDEYLDLMRSRPNMVGLLTPNYLVVGPKTAALIRKHGLL